MHCCCFVFCRTCFRLLKVGSTHRSFPFFQPTSLLSTMLLKLENSRESSRDGLCKARTQSLSKQRSNNFLTNSVVSVFVLLQDLSVL